MQRVHKVRYYPMILAIAFLFNAILPFFAVYPSAEHTDVTQFASVFGDKILLCTGDGFKWVKTADLQSGKEKPKPHSDKCPLCYMARHNVKAIVPAVIAFIEGVGVAYAPVYVHSAPPLSLHRAAPLNGRAPPASLIV